MSDPFGKPPVEEDVIPGTETYPEADPNDPYGSLGTYNEEGVRTSPKGSDQGTCIGKVIAAAPHEGPSGPCVKLTVCGTEGRFNGRDFDLYISFSQKAKFKLDETYAAIGLPKGPFVKSRAIGVFVTLKLKDEQYNGQWSAKCSGLLCHPKGAGFRGSSNLPV